MMIPDSVFPFLFRLNWFRQYTSPPMIILKFAYKGSYSIQSSILLVVVISIHQKQRGLLKFYYHIFTSYRYQTAYFFPFFFPYFCTYKSGISHSQSIIGLTGGFLTPSYISCFG